MVIMHVAAPAPLGGLERVVQALATGQQGRGHTTHVVAVADAAHVEPDFLAPLRAHGVTTHAVRVSARAYARERQAIRHLCRELSPDVVHTHGYRVDVVDAPVARALGIAAVSTVHGFTRGSWRNRLYERIQRRALRRMDRVVAVSRPLEQELTAAGIPPERVIMVQNAWAPPSEPSLSRAAARETLQLASGEFVIGWVGRVSGEKGPDVLLAALRQLEGPWRCVFVGEGPDRAVLRERSRRQGLAPRVLWPGLLPAAGRLMPAFDVFALSSRTEGTPIVLFEAMAAGVPIVAARAGGVPDVVGAAEAVLVPSENPAALAEALGEVRADPAGAEARAQAARERLRTAFAREPWLQRYEAVYREAAQVRKERA